MATNDSAMPEAPGTRADRRANGSPPPTQSKRDKRRQLLHEKLTSLSAMMSKEKGEAYRDKLQKIQIDSTLIMRLDPYDVRPFDALEEDLARHQANGESDDPVAARPSLLDMAGPKLYQWIERVQDLAEQRDYALTKYKFDHEKKVSEYRKTHAYKVETANREFKALAGTLRDRLINAINSKKFRLNKEKEALEISDASALLLHPNQFSITNPASPGGTHGKRATRLRRDLDEMPSLDGSKKRKRNQNDDDGSPAPQRRALDPSSTTPLWQNDRLTLRKTTGPIYSIDKLFTDKELSMTYNQAALAAHRYILTHKPKFDEQGRPIPSPDGSESGAGEHDEHDESDSVPSAPMMERNVSHATRSGRGGANNPNFVDDKMSGLELLSSFDFPGNFERMMAADPKLPPTFPSTYVKGHNKQEFNTPCALSADAASHDWMMIQALRQYDQINGPGSNLTPELGNRKLLEVMAVPARESNHVAVLQGDRPSENDFRKLLGLPTLADLIAQGEQPGPYHEGAGAGTPSKTGRGGTPANQSPAKGGALGGVPMSRQSSANGAPMSRSSSRRGGKGTRGGGA